MFQESHKNPEKSRTIQDCRESYEESDRILQDEQQMGGSTILGIVLDFEDL